MALAYLSRAACVAPTAGRRGFLGLGGGGSDGA
jgi:hypothetical protein